MKRALPFAMELLLTTAGASAQTVPLTIDPDQPVAISLDGNALGIVVETGNIDRLILHSETISRLGIKPAGVLGKANLRIGPTKILSGRNRPMTFSVAGVQQKGRIFWFEGATGGRADGSIGPWGMPQDHVAIRLGGTKNTLYRFPLFGSINSQSVTSFKHDGGTFGLLFAVEDQGRLPIASAAAGAAIAAAYGGVATDEIWEETIMLGVQRPVRLVKLGRPLVVGPFSFSEIAVRVRDRRDGSGSGDALPAPPKPEDDPAEIVVTGADKKGPRPIFTFSIGRTSLQQCSSLDFVKSAKEIRLYC